MHREPSHIGKSAKSDARSSVKITRSSSRRTEKQKQSHLFILQTSIPPDVMIHVIFVENACARCKSKRFMFRFVYIPRDNENRACARVKYQFIKKYACFFALYRIFIQSYSWISMQIHQPPIEFVSATEVQFK